MIKQILDEVPIGFIAFILYVGVLATGVGIWVMQMVTGS